MIVLGIHGSYWHDPAAALVIDGQVVAAVEQERLSRRKHAIDERPVEAVNECLAIAGVSSEQVDRVAYSWSASELDRETHAYWRRNRFRQPRRAWRRIRRELPRLRADRPQRLFETLDRCGIGRDRPVDWVEHHQAHAASSFYPSGFERAAILSFDGMSDLVTTFLAVGTPDGIEPVHSLQLPDSLGLFYSTFTDYLGFSVNDGEYKLMGMAPYGQPGHHDLSDWIRFSDGEVRVDPRVIGASGRRRWNKRSFGPALVDRWGPPREGDSFLESHANLAAEVQATFERAVFHLLDTHLSDVLAETGSLCLAGGCALNVVLNRKLIERDDVSAVFVPPGPADPGTAIGAALEASRRHGVVIRPWASPYLGPEFTSEQIELAVTQAGQFEACRLSDPSAFAAGLLARGEIVGWFQGRMEWGPRALGHRSLLGHPGLAGTADRMNANVKFREGWRPFCPSILAERFDEIFPGAPPSPYMNTSYLVASNWRERLSEVTHVDGTARPQTVTRQSCSVFHDLIQAFERQTGLPCVMNTSLNRRGEPIVARPEDALHMLAGSGLEIVILEDVAVWKPGYRLAPSVV